MHDLCNASFFWPWSKKPVRTFSSNTLVHRRPFIMWSSLKPSSSAYDLTEGSTASEESVRPELPEPNSTTVIDLTFESDAEPSHATGAASVECKAEENTNQNPEESAEPSKEGSAKRKRTVLAPVKLEKVDSKSYAPTEDEGSCKTQRTIQKHAQLSLLWGQRQDNGLCSGSNQLPCCFGESGNPAGAGPSGRCDLCTGHVLESLHEDGTFGQARITHLLKQLEGKPLEHALVRIKLVLGEQAKLDYAHRRSRALYRSLQRQQKGRFVAGNVRGADL